MSSAETQPSPRKNKKKRDKNKDREERRKEKENEGSKEPYVPKVVNVVFAGNKYSGIIKSDQTGARTLEGAAEYTWQSGIKYEGPFTASHIEGRGKFTWPDGSVYEGAISNGKRHGDGIYVASDGVTKFEGQWVQGKRHGTGRISYDLSGDAHYLGQWEDGWKHGEGRQVWPSGNVYDGQWKFGKMAGEGTMTWKDTGLSEVYSGSWEDDNPQGVGTHTWHAPQPKMDIGRGVGPSQQMNNRYHGEWNRGVRHGQGSFFYANGATYSGAWNENVKHGQGRYTFENGKLYSGPFTSDQMKEYRDSEQSPLGALNIGAGDNPVLRCIDVSDLELFALPPDVGPMDANEEGSGYDETEEVMREVHNTLLRYLGELKQTYHQYRKILNRATDDPFVLSMHQVWMFARDFNLLTPSFSLSAFNRCALSGPRHHQEVAGDEEVQELRPLTPRQENPSPRKPSHMPGSHLDLHGSPDFQDPLAPRESAADASAVSCVDSEAESEASSVGPSTPRSTVNEEGRGSPDTSAHPASPTNEDGGSPSPIPDTEAGTSSSPEVSRKVPRQSMLPPLVPLHTKFWRKEAGGDLADIHSPATILLFRHFLEIFVRVAVARFPNEKGLEQQVRRLFKESLAPKFGTDGASADIFGFLLDPDIGEVFSNFRADLWRVFKDHAVGEGVYAAPQWVTPEAEITEAEITDSRRGTKSGDGGATFGHVRSQRRGWGGQQRRVHLKARMDVTVRVKDVLRLLDSAGLISPPGPREHYPPFMADIHSAVLTSDTDARIVRAGTLSETPIADLAGLKGLFPGADEDTASPELPTLGEGASPAPQLVEPVPKTPAHASEQVPKTTAHGSDEVPKTPAHGSEQVPKTPAHGSDQAGLGVPESTATTRLTPRTSLRASLEADSAVVGGAAVVPHAEPETSESEVLVCDFKASVYEILQLVCEVSGPDSKQNLRWALRGEETGREEHIGVADFIESELTYCEFQRLLLRITERKTQELDPDVAWRLPVHRRLQGFLKHVFFPSLECPLASAKEVEQQVEASELVASDEQPVVSDASLAPDATIESATEDAAEVTVDVDDKPRPFVLWRGFEGCDLHCQEEMGAPRAWPEEYEAGVVAW